MTPRNGLAAHLGDDPCDPFLILTWNFLSFLAACFAIRSCQAMEEFVSVTYSPFSISARPAADRREFRLRSYNDRNAFVQVWRGAPPARVPSASAVPLSWPPRPGLAMDSGSDMVNVCRVLMELPYYLVLPLLHRSRRTDNVNRLLRMDQATLLALRRLCSPAEQAKAQLFTVPFRLVVRRRRDQKAH